MFGALEKMLGSNWRNADPKRTTAKVRFRNVSTKCALVARALACWVEIHLGLQGRSTPANHARLKPGAAR
jgi:hypothetical protein